MTLILTLCTPACVLQVSDRLLTQGSSTFDAASNKNVIYHAKNALVSIGYSGPAYLEGVPTDRWIAEKLRGERFKDVEPGEPWIMMGRAPQWLDIGRSLDLLRSECEEIFASGGAASPIYIVVGGWQWTKRDHQRARPILGEAYSLPNEPNAMAIEWVPRDWSLMPNYPFQLAWRSKSILSPQEVDYLANHLTLMWLTPGNAVRPLVQAIRRKARRSAVVGADCMSISLPHPALGFAEAVYIGSSYHRGHVKTEAGKTVTFPVGYSPWLVGPNEVIPPQLLAGKFEHQLGPVTVRFAGPQQPPGPGLRVQAAMLGQKRPPNPSRN